MSINRLQNLPILFNRLNINTLNNSEREKIAAVDALLPQTQCGLCDHADGCLPYAVSIVIDNEPYNRCVPGGQPVTDAIAVELNREDNLVARPSQWPVSSVTNRPSEMRAIIREDDCIGCTKCIPACPVDAIVGTGKHMHTILTDLCTGCELCLPPCPVDCIDLVETTRPAEADTLAYREQEQAHLRARYHTHLNRVADQMADKTHAKPVTSMVETKLGNETNNSLTITEEEAKTTIATAKLRTKIKKLEKQLASRHNPSKQSELDNLKAQLREYQA